MFFPQICIPYLMSEHQTDRESVYKNIWLALFQSVKVMEKQNKKIKREN